MALVVRVWSFVTVESFVVVCDIVGLVVIFVEVLEQC